MPIDLGILLLGSVRGARGTVVSGRASGTSRPSDPVVDARNALDKINTMLDQLRKDLNEMKEEDERGSYRFDDLALKYKVRGPKDLEAAWKEINVDHVACMEQIPYITSKQATRKQIIFSSNKKDIQDYCNVVDSLLMETDELNTDFSVCGNCRNERFLIIS
ncbi:hypothetical protein BDY19DRAFT_179180 [Irpex rosettiformis]|uniref:Uncharacterized protein n=1 Tax=Irpex rosettiformis TaxID=378272 RepID=A0ACB8U345_9APHY|nr:hypothetical protein BDY19DRAFT_179180 [Irpex rosettiformis]